MIISIKTIDHKDQRYETVGDWEFIDKEHNSVFPESNLQIRVSDLKDEKMNCLIVVHELIEALLCRFNDPEITTEMVDKFDNYFNFHFNNLREKKCELEPGDSPEAPYHLQHMFASEIERAFAEKLGVNWEDYERRINEL